MRNSEKESAINRVRPLAISLKKISGNDAVGSVGPPAEPRETMLRVR